MVQIDTEVQLPLPDFIKLWNFGNPAKTEQKFREILPHAEAAHDLSYLAQLLTQIARTQGLQGKFDDAHATLDRVEKMLTSDLTLAHVRYHLERGRVFNSSNHPDQALPLFMQAYELAGEIKEMKLAIDAIHMIAIAKKDPKEQVEWNLKGIAMAETNINSRGWLWALYNNIGESYLVMKDYENARFYFHKLVEFQIAKGGEPDMHTLKDEARAIRLSGNPADALAIIEPIFKKLQSENQDDGWIREEMAENLYALGKKTEAKPHFVKAYELLSKEDFCIKSEQEKLQHLNSWTKL